MSDLARFNDFLASIDLTKYRSQYAHIKLVELDMPKHIRPMNHIYREYWTERNHFPLFEEFYEIYSSELARPLKIFRKETLFSKETFERGLPARIYRTWASLLTQIQGGYVAETIYGKGTVHMSAELDFSGIDLTIKTEKADINIQIKKETLSREVRTPKPITKRGVKIVNITYEVPGVDPTTPTGKESVPFKRWEEKWGDKLKRLDNGFIIFRERMFSLDNITNR